MKAFTLLVLLLIAAPLVYAGGYGKGRQSGSLEAEVNIEQSVNEKERKYVAQAAPATGYAPGNDGLTAYSPFGGISRSEVAEVNKLKIAAEILGPEAVATQMLDAIRPCSLFGIPWKPLERKDFGLGGFLCWSTWSD